MADDRCQRCGTGLDGDEDAFPWCDLCWDEMRSGSGLTKEQVRDGILAAQAEANRVACDLPGCENEAAETLEVRAGALIRMAVCPEHADDLEAGLGSGSWTISEGIETREHRPTAGIMAGASSEGVR